MKIGSSGCDRIGVAADHQAVADLEAPDPARGPGIDVADPLGLELVVPPDVVVEVRVAAVDDRVARLEVLEQLGDLRLGRVAGRDHDPDRPRLRKRADELLDRERRLRALAGDLLGLLRGPVVDDDLVAVADEPADHVGPHPAEADEPELHRDQASVDEGRGERPFERGQPGVGVGAEVDPQDRQVVRFDGAEVARGLGVDELAEGVRPARDVEVGRVVGGQLEEPADRRAALVELAGRVQEARAVAGRRRALRPVAQQRPDPGEGLVAGRRSGR